MSDRTVHAVLVDGTEVVRYDRAGKWFTEGTLGKRRCSITMAARLASQPGAKAYLGLPGGMMFDAKIRRGRA